MASKLPKISDSEWIIMQALWSQEPQTAKELASEIGEIRDWSERTVKSLLNRLVKKGALEFELEGKRYLYRTAVSQSDCMQAEGRSFMERVFGGSASPLLAHFLEKSELSPGEIDELERLLKEKRGCWKSQTYSYG